MSDSLRKPWNNNPNTPQIPYVLYFVEKAYFAGVLIGAIGYGTVIHAFVYRYLPCLLLQGLSLSCSFNVLAHC